MKVWRILQLILLVLVAGYLLLLHQLNMSNILMPFFLSMPPALLVAIALLLGYAYGFLPTRLTLWRRDRELNRLKNKLSELAGHEPLKVQSSPKPAVPPEHIDTSTENTSTEDINAEGNNVEDKPQS